MEDLPTAAARGRLWIREPGHPPRSASLGDEHTLIGRGDHCQIQLSDDKVSWDHLELTRHGSTLIAADLGSRNGTVLNGRPLERPTRVRHGDTLLLGSVQIEIAAVPGRPAASTAAAGTRIVSLTDEERELARALVRRYRDPRAIAPRPATRAELAEELFVSERTVQRRVDALARKLHLPSDAGRNRSILIAEYVLAFGLDQQRY
jgi:predicted component of type VI protein secretion system